MQKLSPIFELSPAAKTKLSEVLSKQSPESLVRVELVESGGCGCGGPGYAMSIVKAAPATDVVEDLEGVKLSVPSEFVDAVRGSKIDYVESLERSGFVIDNPNFAGSSCGCGGH
jgi:iron-sulfur cluster assembly accessory protein